jgi:UDP:flavonoid glycosyltransferase YjiC (YdhE family)
LKETLFKLPKPKCLFIVNGLGMGNSTRCHAVMEHLAEAGIELHVLTSGNGLAYFGNKPGIASVNAMESFFYSGRDGGVSGWSTLKSLRALAAIGRSKRAQLDSLLERIRPQIAVVDSEYAISPLRRRHIPIVGLNTSEMIVTQYLKRKSVPPSVRSHFWCVEFSDYLFHRHFCDFVLSPFPLRTPTRNRKFRRIGLIVRRSVRELIPSGTPPPSPRQWRTVVFMLSGSVHASKVSFDSAQLPFNVEVVGRDGESKGKVKYHGRLMNNLEVLARADALVINGGYSAVSEAFQLGKPVFVVPVPGHAEQFINGCLVEDLGLGISTTESEVLPRLLAMYEQDQWIEGKGRPAIFETDGAREAAGEILSAIEQPAHALAQTPSLAPTS